VLTTAIVKLASELAATVIAGSRKCCAPRAAGGCGARDAGVAALESWAAGYTELAGKRSGSVTASIFAIFMRKLQFGSRVSFHSGRWTLPLSYAVRDKRARTDPVSTSPAAVGATRHPFVRMRSCTPGG
jgi:hypothetical protein